MIDRHSSSFLFPFLSYKKNCPVSPFTFLTPISLFYFIFTPHFSLYIMFGAFLFFYVHKHFFLAPQNFFVSIFLHICSHHDLAIRKTTV
ncbi:hypothetical protein BDC45DRAFT_269461 [Circinella umbellata]|nr:hypothetical protein BDC45DRAFT_269461 [Circinella umbellata]